MKIAILGSRGVPNRYGGFEEMAAQVAGHWSASHDVTIYTVSDHPEKCEEYNGAKVVHIYNPENNLGLAGQFIYDLFCILHVRRQKPDVILQLGYTTSAIWSFLWPKKIPTVVNMDGIEHKRAKYKGPLASFLRWSEKRAIKGATALVADNEGIASYLQGKAKGTPISTITYGATVPAEIGIEWAQQLFTEHGRSTKPGSYLLHVGRIQPDNHIKEFLAAAATSGIPTVAIGDYTTLYGQKLKADFSRFPNILFAGTVYCKNTLNALRAHCLYYIHGHSAGGTNPALLEAMACQAYVLAHDNTFNRSTLGGHGEFWSNTGDLAKLLASPVDKEGHKKTTEEALKKIQEHHQWSSIASQYLDLFASILR